jgi:hypothetical protein
MELIHLFPALKQNCGGYKFKEDRWAEKSCDTMADNTGNSLTSTGNREARPTMCVTNGADYAEIQWDSSTIKCVLFSLEMKLINRTIHHN